MTVLSRYERLESPGVWRADAEAQRKNVFVSLGKATLVIVSEGEVALSHWSLPALERTNPGVMPALYRPGADSSESLELDDKTMVDAIETVRGAIRRRAPHHGRLRGLAGWMIVAVLGIAAVLWVPGAIRAHTAAALPQAVQANIGERLLRQLVPVTGPTCTHGPSLRAADRLADRLFPDDARRVAVLSGGPVRTMSLPGGTLLIHRELIEKPASAEVPAGYLLAEAARAESAPPLVELLDHAGLWTSLRLLTTGNVSDGTLRAFAEGMPLSPAEDTGDLGARFAQAQVAPAAYLFDLTSRAMPVPKLTNAATEARPLLSDADWVRLQDICAR
ncbi:MAG: hypothetical protein NXH97_08430 [Rhodobacteraceae bacterium]|nr:hypothetical protein [Paracoccaceae bacterium]